MYRHALPPGFVLKSEKKAAEELAKKEKISLEDFLEVEVCPPAFSPSSPLSEDNGLRVSAPVISSKSRI